MCTLWSESQSGEMIKKIILDTGQFFTVSYTTGV